MLLSSRRGLMVTGMWCGLGLSGCNDPRPTRQAAAPITSGLTVAESVATWLRSVSQAERAGRTWPDDARRPGESTLTLGSGNAGKVVFLLALHHLSGDAQSLDDAMKGADYVAAAVRAPEDHGVSADFLGNPGLYQGVGGVAFALHEAWRSGRRPEHREAAIQALDVVHRSFQRDSAGTMVLAPFNEVLFGNAGAGLFLLYAAREMGDERSRELAVEIGDGLLQRAIPQNGGFTWRFNQANEVVLPNFSHGAGGIGFFLGSLFRETGERRFLEGALGAGRYLESIADTSDGRFLVPYGFPSAPWRARYDVDWAHGIAGTARLFVLLAELTHDVHWRGLVRRAVRTVELRQHDLIRATADSGALPLNFRFGIAGVLDFLAAVSQCDASFRSNLGPSLAVRISEQAARDAPGLYWTQRRDSFMSHAGATAAFTGLLHGAAGIGLASLRLHAQETGSRWPQRLPDDPFTGVCAEPGSPRK